MAVLEVCTFSASDADAVAVADAAVQTEFAYQQPGLLRRTTARGEGDRWCVVTLWATGEDAQRAEAAARDDEVARAFWALAAADSVRTERFRLLG